MLDPATSSHAIFLLLVPKDSIIMSEASHQVWYTVTIDILRMNKSGSSQVELRMKYPLSFARIRRRFEPPFGGDDIRAAVSIYIARSDAMTIALRTNFMPDPWVPRVLSCQFVPSQWKMRVSELGQELKGFSDIQNVNQEGKFHGRCGLNDVLAP